MLSIKNASVERLMLLGFGLTLGVLLLVAGIAWNIAAPMAPFHSVDHTRVVIAALDDLRSQMDRAEKYQQNYFLTQEKTALQERDAAGNALKLSVQKLLLLTSDNPLQQERIQQLQTAVGERIRVLAANQAVFDAQGHKAMQSLVSKGSEASAEVRRVTEAAIREERTLLDMRKASEALGIRIIISSVIALLLFLVPLTVRIRRVVRSRVTENLELDAARDAL